LPSYQELSTAENAIDRTVVADQSVTSIHPSLSCPAGSSHVQFHAIDGVRDENEPFPFTLLSPLEYNADAVAQPPSGYQKPIKGREALLIIIEILQHVKIPCFIRIDLLFYFSYVSVKLGCMK
jgi:hypothetical protein